MPQLWATISVGSAQAPRAAASASSYWPRPLHRTAWEYSQMATPTPSPRALASPIVTSISSLPSRAWPRHAVRTSAPYGASAIPAASCRGQSHQESVGCGTSAQPEHGRERVALRDRQLVEVVQQGRAQLMQAAVGQVHFRLHPDGGRDFPPTSLSPLTGDPARQVGQQGALPYARLTAQDEDPTRTREHVGHDPVECFTLVTTSEQLSHGTTPWVRRLPAVSIERSSRGQTEACGDVCGP